MGKSLIIAEKPSVAADIARALGGFTKHEDFFESDEYVISSAVGHLLEIAPPEDQEVKRGKWSFANLPAIPSHFDLLPIEKSENRLKVLTRLLKRKDIDSLINACDAGREGELIFRHIQQFTKTKHPVQRLWLQSMTPQAIRDGFTQLRSDRDMAGLADAARCRSEADWLIGINGTRAMTAFNSRSGGFQLTTVGRVQTPTLAILVEREHRIRAFKPRNYWEVTGTFGAAKGEYTGRWFDEKWKRDESDEHARAERIWDEAKANAIVAKCTDQPGVVTEESKPSTQSSPLLFDLTSLQREANSRFGLSAKTTLSLAQALYEKHKVLTYPRTDSRALPEDYIGTVKATMSSLAASPLGSQDPFAPHAARILKEGWVRPNKRIFDNAKISDHFAIIPTLQTPKALNDLEQKLYDMVVKRFLAVFFPPAEYLQTTRITRVADEAFKSEGKVLVNPGWLAIYGKEVQDADANLVPIESGETVATQQLDVAALVTRPPARYSEATLLSAMEGAGKLVDDEELRAAMAAKGLGTPATRAQIIEGLILEKYVLREGKELVPTAKAFSLMTLLQGLSIPELTSPETTGEWEYKLARMERGDISREAFMNDIREMTKHLVGQAKNYEADTIPGDFGVLAAPCPKCGGEVHENYKKFQCQKCDFAFWKILAGRQLEVTEAETLIRNGEIGPLEGFRSRLGRAFSSKLVLKRDPFEVAFDWGQNDESDLEEAPEFDPGARLGDCPKCKHGIFEHGTSFVCEKSLGTAKTCDFRAGRTILQRAVTRDEFTQLLATGKTPLLQGFVSKKGRPFAAYLVKDPSGKIGFEFEPRAAGAKAPRATAAPLRELGAHPEDGQPVTVHAGRYGAYVKHGDVNATITGDLKVETITLAQGLALIAERIERTGVPVKKAVAKKAVAKKAVAKKAVAKKTAVRKAA
jgi:DNA topoisomerase III